MGQLEEEQGGPGGKPRVQGDAHARPDAGHADAHPDAHAYGLLSSGNRWSRMGALLAGNLKLWPFLQRKAENCL